MLDKAEDQKESQEQHSSLADSRMMTITKFAWDEKVEQVRQLRERNEYLEGYGEESLRIESKLREERDKLVDALEWYAGDGNKTAQLILSEIKGQGDESQ